MRYPMQRKVLCIGYLIALDELEGQGLGSQVAEDYGSCHGGSWISRSVVGAKREAG
jgi:hypothetical protein